MGTAPIGKRVDPKLRQKQMAKPDRPYPGAIPTSILKQIAKEAWPTSAQITARLQQLLREYKERETK